MSTLVDGLQSLKLKPFLVKKLLSIPVPCYAAPGDPKALTILTFPEVSELS